MNAKKAILIVVLALAAFGTGYAFYAGTSTVDAPAPVISETETAPAQEPATATTPAIEPSEESITEVAPAAGSDALGERALGNPSAPVRIDEFASLTCSHCATFSVETFDQIVRDYVDTGKVYFVFNDFPLNVAALEGSMVARCLPAGSYFNFIKFLFKTQNDWAFDGKHREYLKQNSKLLGLSDEAFDACINNQDLKDGLVKKMQDAAEAYGLKSTPSFVINQGKQQTITGAQPYDEYKRAIEQAMAPPAPTTTTPEQPAEKAE